MKLFLAGVRGSTPAAGAAFVRFGGNTPSVAVVGEDGSVRLILDAGTGIRRLGEVLGPRPFRGTLLFTHLHWDHVQGLPFFGGLDRDEARARLMIPVHDKPLEVLSRLMSPPFFPVGPDEMNGMCSFETIEEGECELEDLHVLARRIPHKGGPTFGYRIGGAGGSFAYISDHNPAAAGEGPDGLGEYHPAILDLVEGVDVLIHDAQYVGSESPLAAALGHATVEYAIGLASKAGAERLLLFHHHPDRTDDELDAIQARLGTPGRVETATEGAFISVPA